MVGPMRSNNGSRGRKTSSRGGNGSNRGRPSSKVSGAPRSKFKASKSNNSGGGKRKGIATKTSSTALKVKNKLNNKATRGEHNGSSKKTNPRDKFMQKNNKSRDVDREGGKRGHAAMHMTARKKHEKLQKNKKVNKQQYPDRNKNGTNNKKKDDTEFETVPREHVVSSSDEEDDVDDNDDDVDDTEIDHKNDAMSSSSEENDAGWESGSDLDAMSDAGSNHFSISDNEMDLDDKDDILSDDENEFSEKEEKKSLPVSKSTASTKKSSAYPTNPTAHGSIFATEENVVSDNEKNSKKQQQKKKVVNSTTNKMSKKQDDSNDEEEDDDDANSDDVEGDDFLSSKSRIDLVKQIQSVNRKGKKSGGFQSMGLSTPVYKAVKHMGYKVPTPIQRKAIPLALEGRDLVAMARTGSGKSAAFIIPMLEKLKVHSARVGIRGLIITPSRELAQQTFKFVKELGKHTDLRYCMLVGGDNLESHFAALQHNPDIVVATPGRFMHLILEMRLDLKTVEYVVYDEADRLFELGFAEQLREILFKLPEHRQSLLFSATLPRILVDFARAGLSDPALVRLDVDNKFSEDLQNYFLSVKHEEREAALLYLFKNIISEQESTIVFVATRHHVDYVHELLVANDVNSTYIYGPLDMAARRQNLNKFRNGFAKVLVVTDVAARGIDIPLLDNVVNYNFPATSKIFIHRVGRAARAGRCGRAFSLVSSEELPYLMDLQLFASHPLILASTYKAEEWIDANGNDISTPAQRSVRPTYTKEFVLGSMPPSALGDLFEFLARRVKDDIQLAAFRTSSQNAYKLYTKSRPTASSESYQRAKDLAQTAGTFGIHPIFIMGLPDGGGVLNSNKNINRGPAHEDDDKNDEDDDDDDSQVDSERAAAEERKRRAAMMLREIEHSAMLSKLASFRPTETIFEIQRRRFGKQTTVAGHLAGTVHKGNSVLAAAQQEAVEASNIMAQQRKRFAGTIDRSHEARSVSSVTLAQQQQQAVASSSSTTSTTMKGEKEDMEAFRSATDAELAAEFSTIVTGARKQRRSQREQKDDDDKEDGEVKMRSAKQQRRQEQAVAGGNGYRDTENYMGYRPRDEAAEKGYSVKGNEGGVLNHEAAFELVGDDAGGSKPQRGVQRWDRKTHRFVRDTVGADNKRRVKTESGSIVAASFRAERFSAWQRRTRSAAMRVGDVEPATTSTGKVLNHGGRVFRHMGEAKATPGSRAAARAAAATAARLRRSGADVSAVRQADATARAAAAAADARARGRLAPKRSNTSSGEVRAADGVARARVAKEQRRAKTGRAPRRGGNNGSR